MRRNSSSAPRGFDTVVTGGLSLPGKSRWARAVLGLALAMTLGLLLAHASVYWFLTDDAYISFRYARNFSNGDGLVFNPGFERVEGYTNFLWVILLAAGDAIGIGPESSAGLLTLAATILLWGLVVRFALRFPPSVDQAWLIVVPPLLLAATRSVAVWSSGGLETRLFEVLIVGALLWLVAEVEAEIRTGRAGRPVASILLALATLTRPDGVVISATALAAAAAFLVARRRFRPLVFAARVGVFVVPVVAHALFRRLYYGDWLPNTYYAKVDSRTSWSMGWAYVGTLVLEYAAYLWVPLIVAGALHHLRRGSGFVPLLFLGVVVAQAVYVASVGGDHFEYRPLDLCFPLIYLLIYAGAQHLARGRLGALTTAAAIGVVLVGLTALPYQAHRQFPDRYLSAFPGQDPVDPDRARFLAPDRDPLYRFPGLRGIAAAYQASLRKLTAEYVGLRQEEHRGFLDSVVPEGQRLAQMVQQGRIAPDTYLAISCVGAIPYHSGLRILDRLGLTDAHVAHSPAVRTAMAHSKHATMRYAIDRGVDFWAFDEVHALMREDDLHLFEIIDQARLAGRTAPFPISLAAAGDGWILIGTLLPGPDKGLRKFPGLEFRNVADADAIGPILEPGVRIFGERVHRAPGERRALLEYATVLQAAGRIDASIGAWSAAASSKDPEALFGLARALIAKGDLRGSLPYLQEAVRAVPDYAPAYHWLAGAFTQLGEHRRAAETYETLVRRSPEDVQTRLALGRSYLALGDVPAALRQHERLEALDDQMADHLWQEIQD